MIAPLDGIALDAYLVALRVTLPLAMRALPLPRILSAITPRHVSTTPERAERAVERAHAIALKLRSQNTCLYRSMVQFAALRAAGVDATFRMGVLRHDPERGHAWIDVDGVVVGEERDPALVETFRFPPASNAAQSQ